MLNAERSRNLSPGSSINGKYLRSGLGTGSGSSIAGQSRLPWFIILLICVKILSSVSTFLLADVITLSTTNRVPLTTDIHYPPTGVFGRWSPSLQTLAFIQFCSGVIFCIVQKPFATTSKVAITFWEWLRIIRHAIISIVFLMMWTSGLQLSGPFRTMLVASHYDYTLAGIFTAFFFVKSGPRLRGSVLFFIGVFVLLLFDNETTAANPHPHHSPLQPTSSDVVDEEQVLVSKNSLGIFTLVLSLILKLGFNAFAKGLAIDIGGSKRLHALSTLVSGILLFFLVIIDLLAGADLVPVSSNIVSLLFIVLFGFVAVFYVDNVCLKRMEAWKVARVGTVGIELSALLVSLVWVSAEVPTIPSLVAFGLIFLGSLSLTSTEKHPSGGGSFVGYSSDGLPLFSFSSPPQSGGLTEGISLWKNVLAWLLTLLKQIQEDGTSRKIFYFFLINLTFTCIEFLCGTLSNSLGLISDGFHMLFDTIALLIGLCASVMCRWSPTPIFPFGYGRVEVISGFINTLFLLVVAMVVFVEGFERLFDPPTILETHRLLPVSIAGLVVNLCGIFAFKNSTCVEHHDRYSQQNNVIHHSANVKGVFLHIVADTIGSIGVIVSSFVIHQWGILIVDPICSIIVAILVILSVLPLLKDTSRILLLTVPSGLERNLQQVLLQILAMDGVRGYKTPRFWTHSMDIYTGSLHIQVTDETNEQQIIRQVNSLFSSIGFSHFVVQVEKDEFIAVRNKNSVDIDDMDDSDDQRENGNGNANIVGTSSRKLNLNSEFLKPKPDNSASTETQINIGGRIYNNGKYTNTNTAANIGPNLNVNVNQSQYYNNYHHGSHKFNSNNSNSNTNSVGKESSFEIALV